MRFIEMLSKLRPSPKPSLARDEIIHLTCCHHCGHIHVVTIGFGAQNNAAHVARTKPPKPKN